MGTELESQEDGWQDFKGKKVATGSKVRLELNCVRHSASTMWRILRVGWELLFVKPQFMVAPLPNYAQHNHGN